MAESFCYPLETVTALLIDYQYKMGFPCGSDGEESACNAGDLGLIPGSERSPGEGNGYPLQYPRLENSVDQGAWWAEVHGIAKSQTRTEQLLFSLSL